MNEKEKMGIENNPNKPEQAQTEFAKTAIQQEQTILSASVNQEKIKEKPELPKVLDLTSRFAANEATSQKKAA